jgi:hypothetical protein
MFCLLRHNFLSYDKGNFEARKESISFMSANSVLDLTQSLEKIAAQARTLLQQFSLSPRFSADISSIFGQDVDLNQAQVIIQELATSNLIIPVNIRLASELQGASYKRAYFKIAYISFVSS